MSSLTSPSPKMVDLSRNQDKTQFSQPPQPPPNGPTRATAIPNRYRREPGDTPYNTPVIPPPPKMALSDHNHISPRREQGKPIASPTKVHNPHASANTHPFGPTPVNTPNSVEKISRRIASNLLGEKQTVQGRIAPSYERRFVAGIPDLMHRLATQETMGSLPANAQSSLIPDPKQREDWPEKYEEGEGDAADRTKEHTAREGRAHKAADKQA